MIAGHFGLALAVKSQEREVPTWSLLLATALLDVVFVPFVVLGLEGLEAIPGTSGGYGAAIIHADFTHSLVGAGAIAAGFGLVAARAWGQRTGIVLGAVVFSHWLLDLVVHRADLPILPANAGGLPLLGIGVWQWPLASAAIELALVVGGVALYWRSAVDIDRRHGGRHRRLASVSGLLAAVIGVGTLALNVEGI